MFDPSTTIYCQNINSKLITDVKTRLRVDDERSKNAVEIEFLMRSNMSKSSLLMRLVNTNMGKKEWEESVVLVFAVGGHRLK